MPLQISAAVSAPAVTTSWTLLCVMTSAVSSSDLRLWLGAFGSLNGVRTRPAAAGSLPAISAIASFAAAFGLELDVLEDRHALRALEDVLQTLDAGVLTGDDDVAGEALAASGHR